MCWGVRESPFFLNCGMFSFVFHLYLRNTTTMEVLRMWNFSEMGFKVLIRVGFGAGSGLDCI